MHRAQPRHSCECGPTSDRKCRRVWRTHIPSRAEPSRAEQLHPGRVICAQTIMCSGGSFYTVALRAVKRRYCAPSAVGKKDSVGLGGCLPSFISDSPASSSSASFSLPFEKTDARLRSTIRGRGWHRPARHTSCATQHATRDMHRNARRLLSPCAVRYVLPFRLAPPPPVVCSTLGVVY